MKSSIKKKREKMLASQRVPPKSKLKRSKRDKEQEVLDKYNPIIRKYNSLKLTSLKNKFAEEAPLL